LRAFERYDQLIKHSSKRFTYVHKYDLTPIIADGNTTIRMSMVVHGGDYIANAT